MYSKAVRGGFAVEHAAFLIAQNTMLSVGFSLYTHLALDLACPLVPRCLGKQRDGDGERMDQDFSRDLLASDAFAPNISPRVSCPRFKADLVAGIADTRSEDLGVALQFALIQQDNFL